MHTYRLKSALKLCGSFLPWCVTAYLLSSRGPVKIRYCARWSMRGTSQFLVYKSCSLLRFSTDFITTTHQCIPCDRLDYSLWPWNIIITGPYLFLKPWLGLPVPGLHLIILFEVLVRHSLEHDLKLNCAELLEGFRLLLDCSLLTCDVFLDFNGLACKIWLNVWKNEWTSTVNPYKNQVS